MAQRVTQREVAKLAGVSYQTVSNVMNGNAGMKDETRQVVLAAVKKLAYRPNLLARGLASQRTQTLGLLIQNDTNPFYNEIVIELDKAAKLHGYHLYLIYTSATFAEDHDHLERLLMRDLDGILTVTGSSSTAEIQTVVAQNVPIVFIGQFENDMNDSFFSVSADFRAAGEVAAQHLLELGHERVAIIAELAYHQYRLAGFRDTLKASGVKLPKAFIAAGNSSFASGHAAALQLLQPKSKKSGLKKLDPPTAIFATNDLMAAGALAAAYDLGLEVPQDLSVIGLDGIQLSAYLRPALTTVAVPKDTLAEMAMKAILQLISDKPEGTSVSLIKPHLVLRDSTSRPPTKAPKPKRRNQAMT
jgi:DNA-binding LacI/PurR family transcriptional regulator